MRAFFEIIEIGKSKNCEEHFLLNLLPNFPLIKGDENLFKLSIIKIEKLSVTDLEHLIKGLHFIEKKYCSLTKNDFGFGSITPSYKIFEKIYKNNYPNTEELKTWLDNNGGNYYTKK